MLCPPAAQCPQQEGPDARLGWIRDDPGWLPLGPALGECTQRGHSPTARASWFVLLGYEAFPGPERGPVLREAQADLEEARPLCSREIRAQGGGP